MSGISKNIRKITEAWGGKTTGSGIGDAVMDLYNSLPFGVKTEMVEILPEQSVTGIEIEPGVLITVPTDDKYSDISNVVVKPKQKYKFKINGTLYDTELYNETEENGLSFALYYISLVGSNESSFVSLEYNENNLGSALSWTPNFGKTITLAIYEEQEVVKTLDEKFLPKAEAVADVTEAPTAENFNALLASLRAAGYLNS